MPGYNERIYNYLGESDSSFKGALAFEDFAEKINTNDEYVGKIYDYLSGEDNNFADTLDLKSFTVKMREDYKPEKKKDETDVKVEADETVTSIDTDIPTNEAQVNAKYDDYLSILLKDPDGLVDEENINVDQTIALDDNNQPLQGQDLIDHINKVISDKNSLLDLVNNQQDEITYAQKLRNINLKTIATDEEIKAEIAKGKKGVDTYWSGEEDYFGGNAVTPLMGGLTKLDTEENKNTYQSLLPTKENLDKKRRDIVSEKLNYYLKTGPAAQKGNPMNPKDAMAKARKDADEQIERIKNKSYKEYEQTVVDFKSIYGNKLTSDKSLKDNKDYFYVPSLEDFKENPNVIYDIKVDNKDIEDLNYNKVKQRLTQNKFNSKEVQKELNEILEDFEGEKGVSGWNNVVNAYASLATGFGAGKAILENTIGMTVDELLGMKEGSREAYIENQKQLADAIGLSQKGDDLDIAASIHNLRQDAKSLLVQEAALKQLKRKIETDPTATQEDVDNFNRIKDEIILSQKQIQANYEYLGNLTFQGTNVQEILEKTKRSYDQLNVLENIFYNSGVRIATGLATINNEMSYVNLLEFAGINLRDENVRQQYGDYVEDIFGETVGDVVEGGLDLMAYKDKKADEMIAGMAAFGEGLLNEVKEQQRFDDIETAMDGLMWGTEMLTGQLLNTGMSIVIPGGGGLILSAISESGNHMYDLKKRMEGVEWSDKEKKYIQDFKSEFGFNPLGDDDTYRVKPEEVNALQFYGSAGIYGAAEYVSEKITLGNFKMGAKNIRKAFDLSKTKGVVSSNKINQRWINLKESSKDFIKGVPGESFGEGAVTLSQNFAEKYILGNEDVSLLDGITESMMSGLVMSGTMQGPGLMAQTYQAFRGPDRNARIAQRGDDILKLSNNIKANELKLSGLKQDSDSFKDLQQAIQLESAQLHKLAMEQLADQSKVRNEILSYTKGDRQSLIDIFNKEHRLRRQIDKYNDNTAISAESAKASIVELQNELLYQEAKKKYILGNAEWNADKQRSNRFANAYRAKNGTLNKVETVIGDNNTQALENGLAYVDTLNDLTQEEKNQVKAQMKDQFAEADRASIGPKGEKYSINGFAWGDNLTVETTNADGTKSTRKVDLPMTFSIKSTALSEGGNITVQSHEVGHHTLFKQFMENNPDAVGLVDDLEAYVKKNYKEAYDAFLEVKNAYGEYKETGELKNPAEVAEEKLAALSDFMRQNDLQADRTLHNKLFGRFQKYNDGSGQIRTGKDVFDMITSYNQSFKTGELTGLTKAVAEGTVKFDRKSKKPVNLNKTKPNNVRKSLTKSEKQQIEDALNKTPGPKGPDGNYLMSQKDWQADKDRGLSKAITMAMDGTLDGLIVDQMEKGDTIHGLSRDEFMKRVYTKLGMHVYNFNPKVSNSLFGWINTYLGNRVGDVANQAKRQKAPAPIVYTSKKIGDEGGRTVAETIKGDDADTIIAAVDATMNKQDIAIDNLRTRLGIEKGGPLYNKVLAAVEKTFGRTKLKDVSNIKFKQDLKNKFNTELFKAVKNSLGTRSAYKNFIEGDVVFKNKDGKEVKMPRIKMLFDYFAQEIFNKRFEPFKEKLIDPSTGKQARPENNPLFRKRDNITKKELTDYFLGADVQASTKGTRKDALASAIAQELAFDATMEVLEDSDIQNKIKDFYELQGLRQAENFTEKVGKIIDRTPGSKFSKTKNKSVNPVELNPTDTSRDLKTKHKELNTKLQNYWTEKSVRDKINKGDTLISIFNDFYNTLNQQEQQALSFLKNEIEAISTARSLEADALTDYDWDAQMLETAEGNIPFNLDVVDTASFNEYVNNLINEGVIPNPIIEVNGKEINLFQQPTLPGKGPRRKDGTKKITAFSQQEYQNFKDGLQELGKFLPENIKNNGLVKTALSQASTLYVEGKDGVITAAEITGDLKKNKSNNKTEVKNPKVQPPQWGDSKTKKGINSLINDIITDPNFDPSNPADTKKISDVINEKASPEQIAEIQEIGIEVAKALNNMVNSQKPFSPAWWKAFNFANQILTQQTNANTGIFRMMHGVEAVSSTVGPNRPFRMEHNVQNSRFMQNLKIQIIQEALSKLKNQDLKFDKNIEKIYNLAKRNMMLLDKDVQVVADAKVGSPTFNQGLKVLEKKFGKNWLTPERLRMIKNVVGTTKLQEGFDPAHATVVNNILPFGLADKTIHVPSGLTYDQLMLNQMQGKLAVDYISSVTNAIKKQIEKSTLGKEILQNPKTSKVINENADARQNFNNMLAEGLEKSIDPEVENNINQNSITLDLNIKFSKSYNARNEINSEQLNNSGVTRKFSKSKNTTKEVIDESTVLDKALDVARDPNAPVKKIRVFDFDDTLARTKSNVFYTMPDGTKGTLTAEQFAEKGDSILEQGGEFDFSDFNIVRDGKPGPLLEVAKKIQEARGTQDVFVLTARAPESQRAIKKFLDEVGLNIPIENITGLGNSTGVAKANWIVNKAAEGYNDFYFADDAIQNVDAVKKALSVIDVKSKVQQAKIKFSKTVDQTINDMIEHKFGIKSEAEYGDVKARLIGRKKGRFKLFIPPSAEDFVGLLYSMLGKGEVGNMQMDFFKEHLIEPYGRAMENLSRDQNRMVNDFKALKAQLVEQGLIPKNLNKKAVGKFTVQDVSRILAWDKQGIKVPGLTKTDLAKIKKYAKDNPAIDVFAQNLIDINKGDGYAAPNENWLAGTISTDLLDGLRTGKRGKYLKQWKENVDIIFSQKNLNKMEAAMGSKWREAMEDMLRRMESGQNRSSTAGRLENRLLDYINNSVGTVMFFNMRSALLQTISSINFIDFGSNNIFKAAAAFANQKQYWSDFMKLMNSEFLVERRNGLKLNVSESEIADAAATSKNKAKAAIAYILKKGYLPTQFADSFAIASGGATFYRNKIKDLMKKNPDMTLEQAEKQAFQEFREIAEESQQSSRPDRISQQQASTLGRLILAFQNTPMQMNRLGKKSFLDLVNRRKRPGMTQFQSDMSNISRVGYYMGVQSLIFSSLQQALFALAFDDEEPENEKERYYNVANGVINTILNGTGIIGVSVSTLISVARKVYKESAKEGTFPGPAYEDAANEMLNFSPPIDIKLSKLRQAGLTWKYEGYKHDEANWGIDDPAWKSAAYTISGLTNIPLDRLLNKAENVRSAVQDDWETWQRVSLLLGWSKYQIQSKEDRAEERELEKAEKAAFRKRIKDSKTRKYYPKKPLTLQQQIEKDKEEEDQKEFDKYKKMNKPRQVEILDSLGLTPKQIRGLKYEKDRVNKIIQLMNK